MDVSVRLISLLLISCLGVPESDAQANSCPTFGDERVFMEQNNYMRQTGLSLNFDSPSQCGGTVTAWRLCYSLPVDQDGGGMIRVMIYRRSSIESDTYELVPDSIDMYQYSTSVQCIHVDSLLRPQVQENDVVATCTFGLTSTSSDNTSIYSIDDACTSSENDPPQSVSLTSAHQRSLILHLQAAIDFPDSCRIGSNPQATESSTDPGTYLSTTASAVAACSGSITSWHLCYYTPMETHSGSVRVSLWRNTSRDGVQFELVEDSERLISINVIASIARVLCVEFQLESPQQVEVGDVVGVVLPETTPIPLVSTGAGAGAGIVYAPSATDDQTFTEIPGRALHLYADIGPSTTPPPTTPPPAGTPVTVEFVFEILGPIIVFVVVAPLLIALCIYLFLKQRKYMRGRQTQLGSLSRNSQEPTRECLQTGLNDYEESTFNGISSPQAPGRHNAPQNYEARPTVDYEFPVAKTQDYKIKSAQNYEVPLSSVSKDSTQEYFMSMSPKVDYHELMDEVAGGRKLAEVPYFVPGKDEETLYSQLHKQGIKMIPNTDIRILTGEQLGEGQLGPVYRGVWTNHSGFSQSVAVKVLRNTSTDMEKMKLLQEVAMMAQFRHPNLIAAYGISDKSNSNIMAITEYAAGRDLCDHLILLLPGPDESISPNLSQVLLEFTQQICLGMEYLSGKGFVHRNLQAKNILISEDNICKISDFGESRDLSDSKYYISSGGDRPIGWMAPEAIQYDKYSTASDVWSYGCVLYEIWSLGHEPFEGVEHDDILRKIEGKYRLPPPPGCPRKIYDLMIQCWAPRTKDRQTFRKLLLLLIEGRKRRGESTILTIPTQGHAGHPLASKLGAPLEAGKDLYTDLQNTYMQ